MITNPYPGVKFKKRNRRSLNHQLECNNHGCDKYHLLSTSLGIGPILCALHVLAHNIDNNPSKSCYCHFLDE